MPRLLIYLCRAYFALEDWDNAVRNCERAVQLEPNNAIFQLWLGRSYGEKANACSVHPDAYSLARKTVAAFIVARTRWTARSIAIARDLAEYYATAPAIVGGRRRQSSRPGRRTGPRASLRRRLDTWPWSRSNAGQYEQAEHEYSEAIRLDHDSASTYLDLAHYFTRTQKLGSLPADR